MLRNLVIIVCVCGAALAQGSVYAFDMAQIIFVSGDAHIERAGTQLVPTQGEQVAVGDTVITTADAHVYLKTIDNGFISLRPNSRLQVEIYDYDAQHPEQTRIRLNLTQGTMRSISGTGAQAAKQNYRLNTPVAAIGIRGTDYTTVTTQTQTLTSVHYGGVVVAPLSDACTVASLGPCIVGAQDLFANNTGAVLQVSQGRVQAIQKNTNNTPDTLNPPLPQENSKATALSAATSSGDALALAQSVRQNKIVASTPQQQPSMFDWGRWQSLAQVTANTDYSKMIEKGQVIALNNTYFLAQNTPASKLPDAGRYGFALQQSEAYMINNASAQPAAVSNASLVVDFGQKRFDTGLTLTAPSGSAQLATSGSLLADGRLVGDAIQTSPTTSPLALNGSLAGAGGTQAGYIFSQQLNATTQVVGATRWAR